MLLRRIEKEHTERSAKYLNVVKARVAKLDIEIGKAISSKCPQQIERLRKQKDNDTFYLEKMQRDIELKEEQKLRLLKSKAFGTIQMQLKRGKIINAAMWDEIDDTVNSIVRDLKIQLYNSYKLSKLEYHLCLLIRFSFSVREMALLLSKSDSAISLARKRLYKKLTGKDGSAKDLDAFVCSL